MLAQNKNFYRVNQVDIVVDHVITTTSAFAEPDEARRGSVVVLRLRSHPTRRPLVWLVQVLWVYYLQGIHTGRSGSFTCGTARSKRTLEAHPLFL
jgi:hypothetical protein